MYWIFILYRDVILRTRSSSWKSVHCSISTTGEKKMMDLICNMHEQMII